MDCLCLLLPEKSSTALFQRQIYQHMCPVEKRKFFHCLFSRQWKNFLFSNTHGRGVEVQQWCIVDCSAHTLYKVGLTYKSYICV